MADIKSNSNYSSASTLNTPYFSLQDPKLSPDYFKTLTEKKTETNINEKLKLIEQLYSAVKSIILSDAQDNCENKKPFEFPNQTSEFIETKPNETFNLYPNVIQSQRDTVLKTSNTKQVHDPTFDFPKQKTKLGKQNHQTLSNVLNHKSFLVLKLVSFSIRSGVHQEKIQIQNVWVTDHLNLSKDEINLDQLKNKFSDNISILIGADIPELHIC